MSLPKLVKAATQLTPITAAMMKYVDEHLAEQERIKANRVAQVLEFRIENLQSRMADSDREIAEIISRFEDAQKARSHAGSYLCGLIISNAGKSAKQSLIDYYTGQLTSLSALEAAIIYEASGKVVPVNDPTLAHELKQLEVMKLQYPEQFSALGKLLQTRGLLVKNGKQVEPLLLELLSET